MNTRTKVLAAIVLVVFVLIFAAVGVQAQNSADITTLVIAIVIVAGCIGMVFLLGRRQQRTGGLFTGPMTPIKRVLALVLALVFGGFTAAEIAFSERIHVLFPIAAILCLIYALRPAPSSTAQAASLAGAEPQSDVIPRLDQDAWSNPPSEPAFERRWLPITLIAIGGVGVFVLAIGLMVVTNQRQDAAEVATPTVVAPLGAAAPPFVEPNEPAKPEAKSHNELGNAYAVRHDYEHAIAEYSQAIALDSAYVGAYINRGSAYENQGQFDLARQDYETALKIDPNSADAHFKRAILFYDTGDQDRALVDLNKVIELDPNFAPAYVNRGLIFDQRGKYDQALADFDHAIQIASSDPELAEYYFNRAVSYYHQKNYDHSLSDLTQTIQLKPDHAKAFFVRGALLASSMPQAAKNDLEAALQLGLEPTLETQAKQLLEQLGAP